MSLDSLEKKLKNIRGKKEEVYADDASYARFKKIIIGIISFFGLITVAAGIVLYLVLFNGGSRGVDLTIAVPDSITSGVPFDVTATVSNRQDIVIGDAKINLTLPSDFVYLGVATGERGSAATEPLGDVAAGSFTKHSFKVLPVGKAGSSQKIGVGVTYTSGRNSRFELKETENAPIKNSPITLKIKMPDNVIRGSSFEFEVNYTNATQFDFPDLAFQLNYPDTFHYESASIPPEAVNNYWKLGGLKKGETGIIKIKGSYTGPEEGKLEIPVSLFAQFSDKDYEIDTEILSASTAPSPVHLSILAYNQENYVARLGDTVSFTVHYENNSGVALSNVVVKANFDGTMLAMDSIDTNARVNTTTNWLTWDSNNIPQFKLLDAGAKGDLTASVRIKNLFPIHTMNDKNFTVRVSAKLESPTVPYYVSASKTTSMITGEFKIAGLTTLTAQLFFRDVSANPPNEGELPPRAGKSIEYTAHWLVRNFATDVRDVTIRAKLKSGVQFVEALQGSTSEMPTYDAGTGEMVWHIEKIPAKKGVLGNPVEAIFRVRVTPDVTNFGQYMQVLGESILTATDDFTGVSLNARGAGLSTAVPDDRTVSTEDGKVAL